MTRAALYAMLVDAMRESRPEPKNLVARIQWLRTISKLSLELEARHAGFSWHRFKADCLADSGTDDGLPTPAEQRADARIEAKREDDDISRLRYDD